MTNTPIAAANNGGFMVFPPPDRVNRRLARFVFSAPAWRFGSPAWLRFVVQFKLLPEYTRPTG